MKKKENTSVKDEEIKNDSQNPEESTENTSSENNANETPVDELADMKEKYLRLYSDFENFRKRTAKEKIELIQTASEGVIKELLPALDNYERALANAPEGEISEGIQLIFSQITSALQAKGLKERDIMIHHALKNAAVPIIKVIGIGIGLLFSGAVVTETVFAIPGIGRLTVDAILRRDYPIIQGVILIFSATYVIINLLIDLSYVFFDPRIRY